MNKSRTTILVCLVSTLVACGGGSGSPVAPSTRGDVMLNIQAVDGNRWAESGAYAYQVRYQVTHTNTGDVPFHVVQAAILDANGQTVTVDTTIDHTALTLYGAGTVTEFAMAGDSNTEHAYGERLRLRIVYGTGNDVLEADAPITHPAQSGRLHDFSVSPGEVTLGDSVTASWNVSDSSSVTILSALGVPDSQGSQPEAVPAVGTKSWVTRRTGTITVQLLVDGSFRFTKSVTVKPVPPPPTPAVADVAGTWAGMMTWYGATGAEVVFQQSGGAVTGTWRSPYFAKNGGTFQGTVDGLTIGGTITYDGPSPQLFFPQPNSPPCHAEGRLEAHVDPFLQKMNFYGIFANACDGGRLTNIIIDIDRRCRLTAAGDGVSCNIPAP